MAKVLIFSADPKSLYMFRKNLIDHLLRQNIEVICFCSRNRVFDFYKKLFEENRVTLKHLNFFNTGKNPLKDSITLWKLIKILKEEQPTHIFMYHIKPVLYTALCSLLFPKIKIYPTITGIGYLFTSKDMAAKIFRNIVYLFYKTAFKRSSKVFFQNKDDLQLFKDKNIISSSKVVVVPGSGIDLEDYKFQPLPNQLSFIFVGRINKDKGVIEYLAACKTIKKKYPSVSCRLIGSFSENPASISIEDIKKNCEISQVEYIGEVDDVRPWLKEASVFVLPSYREGIPRAGLEALAMGRPIITTNAPGCREIIKNGLNGYCISVKDTLSLEKAMTLMIENQDQLPFMGLESRKLAEQKFDVNIVSKTMLAMAELDRK